MVGIVSAGSYIPKYRLRRDVIGRAWGSGSLGGEKAVCGYDEDTITMAVEAAINTMGDISPKNIDCFYFASTTAPYREKSCASLISTVLDLRQDISSADFSSSLRAGTNALQSAISAIQSGQIRQALVTGSDSRLGTGMSEFEQSLGDAAAALLLGERDVIAEVIGSCSVTKEFTDNWRTEKDFFVKSWENRFAGIGYASAVADAVIGAMKKYSFTPEDFRRIVLNAPGPKEQIDIAKKLGFDPKTQLTDLFFSSVGNTGTAQSLLMLTDTLEQSAAEDRIIWVNYGDGATALVLEVKPEIEKLRSKNTVNNYLSSKTILPTYEKYIQFKELMPLEEPRTFPSPGSVPLFWREKKSFYSFYGSKCKNCGLIQHPIQRVCYRCHSKDNYEEVKLSRTGRIFTYAEDYLAGVPVLPQISGSIDLDDGCRVFLRLTEAEAQNPSDPPQKIGMPVEITFRKLNDNGGFHNYYWKAKPPRRTG